MKTNRLAATILVAFSLCVVNMRGIEVPTGLPDSIKAVGNLEAFRSWIVTNRQVRANFALYFTTTQGVYDGLGGSETITFKSYTGFQQYMASNCFRLFNQKQSAMNPTTQVESVFDVAYDQPDLNPNGYTYPISIDTPIGKPITVTSNSFVNLPTRKEYAYIKVPGLKKFVVEVKGLYTNSWPAEIGRPAQIPPIGFNPPQFPPELTTNNYVILNRWYSLGTNEVTFSITVGPNTRRYNRFGEALDKPPIATISGSNITASFARWATVSIESSSDLSNWSMVTNFVDSNGLGTISMPMPIKKNCPMEFFRVGAH